VFVALVGCSGCPDEVEAIVADLDELERLACECGCGYVVLSVAEVELASPRP